MSYTGNRSTDNRQKTYRCLDTTTGEVYDLCHDCYRSARTEGWASTEVKNPTHEPATRCGICWVWFPGGADAELGPMPTDAGELAHQALAAELEAEVARSAHLEQALAAAPRRPLPMAMHPVKFAELKAATARIAALQAALREIMAWLEPAELERPALGQFAGCMTGEAREAIRLARVALGGK